jgi:hypothetical protein
MGKCDQIKNFPRNDWRNVLYQSLFNTQLSWNRFQNALHSFVRSMIRLRTINKINLFVHAETSVYLLNIIMVIFFLIDVKYVWKLSDIKIKIIIKKLQFRCVCWRRELNIKLDYKKFGSFLWDIEIEIKSRRFLLKQMSKL